jgi:hypothetical protein
MQLYEALLMHLAAWREDRYKHKEITLPLMRIKICFFISMGVKISYDVIDRRM